MKAFTIKIGDEVMDYRLGQNIDLEAFSSHLKQIGYGVEKIWNEKRHAVGILEKRKQKLFVKLATSPGISKLTENEFNWNDQFNKLNPRTSSNFWVPVNFDSGYFENLFYFITDYIEGKKLADRPNPGYDNPNLSNFLAEIIDYSELIQKLSIEDLEPDEQFLNLSHQKRFLNKAKMWFDAVPNETKEKYSLIELFSLVEEEYLNLEKMPRHGDFTPWHLFKLDEGKLLLIDGEHTISNGVQYYDIAYLIQRVFSILEDKNFADIILTELEKRNYDFKKLKTVLAARAIGGFLDRSLNESPDYLLDSEFKNLVINL